MVSSCGVPLLDRSSSGPMRPTGDSRWGVLGARYLRVCLQLASSLRKFLWTVKSMLERTAPARLLHESGGTLLGCFERHATPQVACLGLGGTLTTARTLAVAPVAGVLLSDSGQSVTRSAQAGGGFRLEPKWPALSLSLSLSLPLCLTVFIYIAHIYILKYL